MQVQANVDEADIGQVRMLQPVDFTVDAYPNEIFKGSVRQIRLQPVVTSNVVTYTVIVNAPNPEKKLMPGMTANITVLVQKIDSVLIVPGKALRFTPDAAYLTEYFKKNPPPNRNQGAGGTGQAAGTERQRNPGEAGQSGAPGSAGRERRGQAGASSVQVGKQSRVCRSGKCRSISGRFTAGEKAGYSLDKIGRFDSSYTYYNRCN